LKGKTMDNYPPAVQRQVLLELAEALGSRKAALHRDECEDWRISGSHGHVYAVPGIAGEPKPGFHFFVLNWKGLGWANAKLALSFAKLTNDGEDEGSVFLDRLPTPEEAAALRHYCGIHKKAEYSGEALAALRVRVAIARQAIERAA
jgi:hypothetical protein